MTTLSPVLAIRLCPQDSFLPPISDLIGQEIIKSVLENRFLWCLLCEFFTLSEQLAPLVLFIHPPRLFIYYFLIKTRKLGHVNYGLVSTVTQSLSGFGPAASERAHLTLLPASFRQCLRFTPSSSNGPWAFFFYIPPPPPRLNARLEAAFNTGVLLK